VATTEYIVTDADVGFVFPEKQGFLLSLVRSRGPYQDCYKRNWHERHLLLRDERPSVFFCMDAINYGNVPLVIGGARFFLTNACIGFTGALNLACVPAGSEWELIISDIWVPTLPPLHPSTAYGFAPTGMWGNGYRRQQNQVTRAAPPMMLEAPIIEHEPIEREA
jgi:hypothetical protein